MKVTISGQAPPVEQPMRIVIDLVGSEAAQILQILNYPPYSRFDMGPHPAHPVDKLIDALQRVRNGVR